MRVESAWPAKNGGWYHYYDGKVPRPALPVKRKEIGTVIDCEKILMEAKHHNDPLQVQLLAKSLGVTADSLNALNATWSNREAAWMFPMRDGDGNIIGLRTRYESGEKKAVKGSRQGIFIPDEELKLPMVFLVEGPTDCAALLSMGLFAIGRPNNIGGIEHLGIAIRRMGIFKTVVVADNDKPGIDGAYKVKAGLGVSSALWLVPAPLKDVREYYQRGGTAQMIESDLRNKVWKKG